MADKNQKSETIKKDMPQENNDKAETSNGQEPPRPQLNMHAQYIKDLSFESPSSPDVFTARDGTAPDVNVNVNVSAKKLENDHFEVMLKIMATAETKEHKLFIVDLSYAGIVSTTTTDERIRHPLVLIEGPRLLFPFARALLSSITADGGFLPLNLNPVDFVALYAENIAQKAKNKTEDTKDDKK